jgi:hypothetical protein
MWKACVLRKDSTHAVVTSHAALYAVGVNADSRRRSASCGRSRKKSEVAGSDMVLKEGDSITLNGTKGNVHGCFKTDGYSENPRSSIS